MVSDRPMSALSWVPTPRENTRREDKARQHKPSSLCDFCSESCAALVTWPGHVEAAFSPGHMSPTWWTQEKVGWGDTRPFPCAIPTHECLLSYSFHGEEMCSKRASWPNLIDQASLERRHLPGGNTPRPVSTATWRNTENPPPLNPGGRTCMWTEVGLCHSTAITFFWCHLS